MLPSLSLNRKGSYVRELGQVKGIGLAKASQIKAAFELANRLEAYSETGKKPVVKTPEDIVALVKGRLKDKKKEYFLVLLLDTRNQLIKSQKFRLVAWIAASFTPGRCSKRQWRAVPSR